MGEAILATLITVGAVVLFAIGIKKHIDAKKAAARRGQPPASGAGTGKPYEPGTVQEK